MKKKFLIIGILAIIITGIWGIKTLYADLTPNIKIDPTSSYKLRIATPNPHNWSNGLVGYWTFDGQDIQGLYATSTDKSGNNNHGAIKNGAFGQAGVIGQALSFDGVDDYVDCGNKPGLNITDAITVEAWMYWNSLGSDSVGIIGKGETPAQTGYVLGKLSSETKLRFYPRGGFGSANYVKTTSDIPTFQWVHYVGTFDGTDIKIYVNGILENTANSPGSVSSNTQPLVLGRWYGNHAAYYLNGLIDEVRVYNRALSAAEIAAIYNATK